MNKQGQAFSIKDLENICGIKAHTIRIWEKRYHLLEPERTDTNIRTYNMESLKKLLNVSFLVNCGYKISRISKLKEEEVYEYVNSIVSDQTTVDRSLNSLKLAMLNFNTNLFVETISSLKERFNFTKVFYDVLLPFLNEVGMLWQTNTINSTHEHFVTNIIKQKLWVEIDNLQKKITNTEKTYVLYLPSGEINLVFVSYFTLAPHSEDVNGYITTFKDEICLPNKHELWVMGRQLDDVIVPVSALVKVIYSFQDFEKIID